MSDGKAKKVAAKKPAEHPKYIDMVKAALSALKERKGSSRQAIVKYIKANYNVGDNCDVHIKMALKRGSLSGDLIHAKGVGASGSFKLAKKEAAPKKKAAAPKKVVVKKPAAKKPVAKKAKSPAKKAAKSPAKKAAAKKPAKKAVAKKSTPKKTAAKKPVAKKTAAKKPVKKTKAKKAAKSPKKSK